MLSNTAAQRWVITIASVFILLVHADHARALPGTPFEGSDGNLIVDGNPDWASLAESSALTVGYDVPTGQDDDSFQGKEDDLDLVITYGSIPNNKSDLLRFYVTHERIPVGEELRDFLYVAWVRANTLGSANMDFEFNQSVDLSSDGVTPVRTAGDILVTFNFSSGGSVPELGLSRWSDAGPCETGGEGPCWGTIAALAGFAEGAVNMTEVFDPVEGSTLPERTFGEAVIDLTDAGVFDQVTCVSFGRGFVKSRSSGSFTASLKDFIKPIELSVSNCTTVHIVKDAVPDDVRAFDFLASPELGVSSFELDDDGDDSNALPRRRSFEGRFDVVTVSELPAVGWDLSAVDCRGNPNAVPELNAGGDPTGTVTLDGNAGDEIECVFTNTKRGRILLEQVVLPAGDPQVFDFLLTGGPDEVSIGRALADADPVHEFALLRPGVYTLDQADSGSLWDLASAVCDDGSPVEAVSLQPGETITCTFVNIKRGRIVVDQVTQPAGDEQLFDFALTGGPDAHEATRPSSACVTPTRRTRAWSSARGPTLSPRPIPARPGICPARRATTAARSRP
jgi:hypothetical protein